MLFLNDIVNAMRNLIKHKVFMGIFLVVYFLYFFLTIYILDIKTKGSIIGDVAYGFPFTYLYTHCYGGYYLYTGLLGNMLFAAILGTFIGLTFSYFFQNIIPQIWIKLTSPEFLAKWHRFRQKWYL